MSGKSTFLLRILLPRLAHKLPTALQTEPNRALLFYEKGVKEFTQLNLPAHFSPLESRDDPQGRVWALVDSNGGLQEPAMVFQRGPFFVVQTSSPRPASCGFVLGRFTQYLLHETMVLYRSSSSVSRFIPEGPQCLCFYSRSLVGPVASEKEHGTCTIYMAHLSGTSSSMPTSRTYTMRWSTKG